MHAEASIHAVCEMAMVAGGIYIRILHVESEGVNDGTDIMRINMLVAGLMVAMIPALCVAVNDVKVSYLSAGSLSVVEVNT
eukprot:Stramenopile-MAST_4_protein_6159